MLPVSQPFSLAQLSNTNLLDPTNMVIWHTGFFHVANLESNAAEATRPRSAARSVPMKW